jgi:hypothetical protein
MFTLRFTDAAMRRACQGTTNVRLEIRDLRGILRQPVSTCTEMGCKFYRFKLTILDALSIFPVNEVSPSGGRAGLRLGGHSQ